MNIVILSNDHIWTYNLRRELIESLIKEEHNITLVLPYGEKIEYFKTIGCNFSDFSFDNHGTNLFAEFNIYKRYVKLLKKLKPDIVLTYSTKPNIYGGMACASLNVPYISSITGIGNAMQSGIFKIIMESLYKVALRKANKVFFQNEENQNLFIKKGICKDNTIIVPGSGVNTNFHKFMEYPDENTIKFLFAGRINRDKGLNEFLTAAQKIHKSYTNTEFYVAGMPEDEALMELLKQCESQRIAFYQGYLSDIRDIIAECHCTVLPSYHEGMANVLLESASAGRPVITTNISGCRETVIDGKSGFLCNVKDADDLADKIIKFIKLTTDERKQMGLYGRKMVSENFSREFVVKKYITEIKRIIGGTANGL